MFLSCSCFWRQNIYRKLNGQVGGCLVSLLNPLFLRCFPVPELLGGKQLSATVIDLSPWVEYEFRVLATNSIGTGEPSKPSKKARTKETRMCQKLFCQGQFNFNLVQSLKLELFKVK